jgi:hypothetical protein
MGNYTGSAAVDITGKADLVSGAVLDNLAALTAAGNLKDSLVLSAWFDQAVLTTSSPTFAAVTVTGTVQAEQLTSTDDITMQGHLLTLGDNSAANIVISFDGSANNGSITFVEASNQFDFGSSEIKTTNITDKQIVYSNGGILSGNANLVWSNNNLEITGDIEITNGHIQVAGTNAYIEVDNLTLDAATIVSDTGTISFVNEHLETSGDIRILSDTNGLELGAGDGTNGDVQLQSALPGNLTILNVSGGSASLTLNNNQGENPTVFSIAGAGATSVNVVSGGLFDYYIFGSSGNTVNKTVRIYGNPVATLRYAQFQIINSTVDKFQITSDTGEIDFDNENLTTTGTFDAGAATVTSLDAGSGTIQTTGDVQVGNDLLFPNAASVINFGTGDITLTYSANTLTFAGMTSFVFGSSNVSGIGTLDAGAITGTSFIIGANTLDTNEWAFLDGQDQAVKIASNPTFAGVIIGQDGFVEFNDVPSGTDKASGTIMSMQVDVNTVGYGGLLHMDTDGNWTDADANSTATMPALGMALGTTGVIDVLLTGVVKDTGWSWTIGGILYASGTVGQMTQTAPAVSGDQVQVVGIALSATSIYFNPSTVLVEVA